MIAHEFTKLNLAIDSMGRKLDEAGQLMIAQNQLINQQRIKIKELEDELARVRSQRGLFWFLFGGRKND